MWWNIITVSWKLQQPLAGELVNFNVTYNQTGGQHYYSTYTDSNGMIILTISPPVGENTIIVTADYAGEFNISGNVSEITISVRPRYNATLIILNQTFLGEYVGGTYFFVAAQLLLSNGIPIQNATLTFQVGTSIITYQTDANGIAQGSIILPIEGSFSLKVTYSGSSIIQQISNSSIAFITVISPATINTRQYIQYAIIAGIIAAVSVSAYFSISRGVVCPHKRARQVQYVSLIEPLRKRPEHPASYGDQQRIGH